MWFLSFNLLQRLSPQSRLAATAPLALRPELNPIERLWQDLRQDFKNQSFNNLASLQQAIFSAVNSLTLEKVASLTSYPFILDALSI